MWSCLPSRRAQIIKVSVVDVRLWTGGKVSEHLKREFHTNNDGVVNSISRYSPSGSGAAAVCVSTLASSS
ncbi:hypothetical protein J6590_020168 [Homalodisca vitripennis]|nr:hypothetical protein J6590_020168 [Homalodisca vitripennis]